MDQRASRPSLVERLSASARQGGRAWHGESRDAIGRLIPWLRRERAIAAGLAAVLLLGIPAAIWIGAGKQSRIAALEADPVPDGAPGRPEIARLFARPTVSDIAERLALALPRGAALGSLAVDGEGGLTVEVELPDPERLRAALAGDPLLSGLRQVSQMSGETGPRVRLFAPASASGTILHSAAEAGSARNGRELAALIVQSLRRTAARTGTLVEAAEPVAPPPAATVVLIRVMTSGQEKALLSFIGDIENGAPLIRFARWRIEPSRSSDGAMRLEGDVAVVLGPSRGFRVFPAGRLDTALNRPLFAQPRAAPAPEEDFSPPPELAGIAGRLPDAAVALVRTPEGGTRTLRIGDSFEGWRLAALAPDAAFFTRGSERVRVALPLQ